MNKRTWMIGLGITLCIGAFACSGAPEPTDEGESESAALINTGGNGVTGGACTVTDGPHTGMGGTYDEDGWCCKANVCVECAAGASGKRRCKDAVKVVRPPIGAPVSGGTVSRAP